MSKNVIAEEGDRAQIIEIDGDWVTIRWQTSGAVTRMQKKDLERLTKPDPAKELKGPVDKP